MKMNVKHLNARTHEGANAFVGSPLAQLRRTVMSCLLWEDNFYENGETIAKRISDLVVKCDIEAVSNLAWEAKDKYKLRHVPLLLIVELLKKRSNQRFFWQIVDRVITRVDDLTEIISIYWKDGKKPLPAALKKGIASAFSKFDEYQFAKYDRDGAIKLRDALFLSHAKPADDARAELYKKIANRQLVTPDTWEVALSAGADKKETFERLIRERKLGYLALLRNLRNMVEANVNHDLVNEALRNPFKGILPFQFIAALKAAPQFAATLDAAMLSSIEGEKMTGQTVILIDCSGSMSGALSGKSKLTRNDAASGLAILARELSTMPRIFCFATKMCEIPSWNGLALQKNIELVSPQLGGGTNLGESVAYIEAHVKPIERFIVITDEQSNDVINARFPKETKKYILNVGGNANGVATADNWVRIDGFSEQSIRYIQAYENAQL